MDDRSPGNLLWYGTILPDKAPIDYKELQTLAEAMERAETRRNARTARQYIGNLPAELPLSSQKTLVSEFITDRFTSRGLCAIAAIHAGRNTSDARKNNPHVHMLVSTRPIDGRGFKRKKDRVLDSKSHLSVLRAQWAAVQNKEYERFHLPYHVSPKKDPAHDHIHDHELDAPSLER